MTTASVVALLDANVLYPARLRDLLIRLAIAGSYQARWTEQILDECFTNLITNRPDIPPAYLDRTRALMGVAVPDATVDGYDHLIVHLVLPDPDDRHVLAAAVVANAEVIVTSNLADFPASVLAEHGIRALSPDTFVHLLIDVDPEAVADVVDSQAADLKNPPKSTAQLLDGLEVVGLTKSVAALRAARNRR